MPATKRITEEKIVAAATQMVRDGGFRALNARELSRRLGCSTRPLYLTFGSMDKLKAAVEENIKRVYRGYLEREVESGKYPPYKSYGMGYIRFAREEKELFSYLFMRNRSGEGSQWEEGGEEMEGIYAALYKSLNLNGEQAKLFHFEMWIFVHGIAAMLANSYADMDENMISAVLTDCYEGLKTRFLMRGQG